MRRARDFLANALDIATRIEDPNRGGSRLLLAIVIFANGAKGCN
jgi:hypothetical protein